ncbi:MAG TPA: acyltransferase family protein [Ideonella sp.]|uniref:acyltransferase family protein n=1 Tax=Ideonella sp. TaxID=1929293 RepID=UPI002CAED1AB|nr:acyltransferase family protein [Ideonella sp.]HSI50554.1 acyltransferase family protein [Ideonella sp.]
MNNRYRGDIDGLRAVAVLVVVLYHLGVPGFPGGFIGVDVFFVISGFLITSLLLAELKTGGIALGAFYVRRMRRILPALLVVVLAVVAAGTCLLFPKDLRDLGRSLAGLALMSSNLFFWLDAGYFATNAHHRPLLHTWSLSVEEQFYLLYPALLWLVCVKARWRPFWMIAGLALASFAACVVAAYRWPDAGYFLLPFRAWELLAGALAATSRRTLPARWAGPGSALGLALILFSACRFSAETRFPGYAALMPVAGAVLVLQSGLTEGIRVSRVLASRVPVTLGRWSYSLYLWHWPLIVFYELHFLQPPDGLARGFLGAGALGLAVLSYRFVEQPARHVRLSGLRVSAAAMTGLMLVFGAGYGLHWSKGLPERFEARGETFPGEALYHPETCFFVSGFVAGNWSERACTFGQASPAAKRVLIWGDSYAAHYVPGLEALRLTTFRLTQVTYAGCGPLMPAPVGDRKDCAAFNQFALARIAELKPDLVLIGARWNRYRDMASLEGSLRRSLTELAQLGIPVLVLGESPTYSAEVPVIRDILRVRGLPDDFFRPTSDFKAEPVLRHMAAARLASWFSVRDRLCVGEQCRIAVNGQSLYWDDGHLTAAGSELVARSLSERIACALGPAASACAPGPLAAIQPGLLD